MSGNGLQSVVNGRPTEPQIRLLMERFGGVERGTIIEHSELEDIIGQKRTTNRYRTVVAKFKRKLLREHGVCLESRAGIGYEALSATEQMKVPVKKMRSAARRIYEGVVVAECTPDAELTESARGQKLHFLTRTRAVLETVRSEARVADLKLTASETLPRVKLA